MRKEQTKPITDAEQAFTLFDTYVRFWLKPLALHQWMVELHWSDADDGWAACEADVKYKRAVVTVHPAQLAKEQFTPLQIESIAIHELTHGIIWPGYNEIANPQIPEEVRSYFEEIAADQLAHSLLMAKYRSASEVETLWQGYKVVRPEKSQ